MATYRKTGLNFVMLNFLEILPKFVRSCNGQKRLLHAARRLHEVVRRSATRAHKASARADPRDKTKDFRTPQQHSIYS